MITTLLFDLDDTLLGNDMGVFLPAYFQTITEHFAGEPRAERLVAEMLNATRAMMANTDPARVLLDVFSDCFSPAMGWTPEAWMAKFDAYYAGPYGALEPLTTRRPAARAILDWAFASGYDVAITTGPVFTLPALRGRLRWAGVDDYAFALVTASTNSHFAKPHPEYFAEVLGRLGRRPEQALVVGDDWHKDILPAAALGMPTYWINAASAADTGTAPQAARAARLDWVDAQPVGQGTLDDFAAWAPAHVPGLPEAPVPPGRAYPYLLAGSLAALHGTLAGLPAPRWPTRPAPSEWSLTEIVCHLRDVEREVNLPRLRTVVENNNPFIAGADTDPWATERDYGAQSGPEALIAFSAARQEAIRFLRAQPANIWSRTARHAIFGPTLLSEIVGWVLDHDRIHLDQVRQTKKRLTH
ncbi:MAG: DinB family protein [Anaerolineales bacterium]|nr:DinB family protein [Anaerolineales bacterium]